MFEGCVARISDGSLLGVLKLGEVGLLRAHGKTELIRDENFACDIGNKLSNASPSKSGKSITRKLIVGKE